MHEKLDVACPRCEDSISCSEHKFVQHMVKCQKKVKHPVAKEVTPKMKPRTYKIQECKQCDFKAKSHVGLKTHIGKAHDPSKRSFNCSTCDYKTAVEAHLRIHQRIHLRPSLIKMGKECFPDGTPLHFYCDKCGKKFSTKAEIKIHDRKVHLQQVVKCPNPGCSYSCLSNFTLKNHILKVHSTDPEGKCPQCDYRGSKQRIKDHMTVHGPPQFACQMCGKQLRTKESLEGHMRTHTGERPYKYVAQFLCQSVVHRDRFRSEIFIFFE